MYCNKIILRAWLPNSHDWDSPRTPRKRSPLSSYKAKTKASRCLTGTIDIFFNIIVFQENHYPSSLLRSSLTSQVLVFFRLSLSLRWVLWLSSIWEFFYFFLFLVESADVWLFFFSLPLFILGAMFGVVFMHCVTVDRKKVSTTQAEAM